MTTRTLGPARPHVCGAPTPLLRHLAGAYAPRIAGLWPDPHLPFIGAGADRRHLICLAVTLGSEGLDSVLADHLLTAPLKPAVRALLPSAPTGLARALGRIGETAWAADDYKRLIAVLGQTGLAQPILHAKTISPGVIRALALLPKPLRDAGLARLPLSVDQIALLAEIHAAIARRDGDAAAARKAHAWAGASSLKDVFGRARDDLIAEFPAPPFPGSPKLKAVATKAALVEAAARYRNCARDYLQVTAAGGSAFYEWTGAPAALVQLENDPLTGWSLAQARIADNEAVPPPSREAIVAELRSWGVHVGRVGWHLSNDARNAHLDSFQAQGPEEAVADLFGA